MMDESFLSHEDVINASRDFVCIRLATYEDESEAEFLKTVYVGRSGELENTVFVMLSPDTRQNLCRPGRGPNFAFRTPGLLAAEMKQIASRYQSQDQPTKIRKLPQLKNVRLGLNVSSCDGLPSIVCFGRNELQLEQMHQALADLAFSEELSGKFVYSSTLDKEDLQSVTGFNGTPGVLLIKPGEYGLEGKLIESFKVEVDKDKLKSAMVEFANATPKTVKHHNEHVGLGNRSGKNWETEIPVTDPGSLRAMQRNNRRGGRPGSTGGR